MRTIGIYKITSPSKKVYVGQSWEIEERFCTYRRRECRGQRLLFHSFQKYGVEAHEFEIVERFDPLNATQEALDEREQFYMNLYRAAGLSLLNCREAGSKGRLSDETKARVSQSLLGNTPWNKGQRGVRSHSAGTKDKMSRAKRGRRPNNYGVRRSEAARSATTAGNRGQRRTEEQRRRISEGMKGNSNRKGVSRNDGSRDSHLF